MFTCTFNNSEWYRLPIPFFFSLCCLDNLESHPAISALEILVLSWKEERQGTFFSLFPKSEDFVFSLEVDCAGLECGHVTVRGDRRLGSIYRKVSCHVTKRYRIKSPKV